MSYPPAKPPPQLPDAALTEAAVSGTEKAVLSQAPLAGAGAEPRQEQPDDAGFRKYLPEAKKAQEILNEICNRNTRYFPVEGWLVYAGPRGKPEPKFEALLGAEGKTGSRGLQGWKIHVTILPIASSLGAVNTRLLGELKKKGWPFKVFADIARYCNYLPENRDYGKFITIYPAQDPRPYEKGTERSMKKFAEEEEGMVRRIEGVAEACHWVDEALRNGELIAQPEYGQRPLGDWKLDRDVPTYKSTILSIRFGAFTGPGRVYNYTTGEKEYKPELVQYDDPGQPYPDFVRSEASLLMHELKIYRFRALR